MTAQNLANFFTRASAGWYYNSAGVLTQAAVNAPRFDYDPVTLALRGLLVEEQRTNRARNNRLQDWTVVQPTGYTCADPARYQKIAGDFGANAVRIIGPAANDANRFSLPTVGSLVAASPYTMTIRARVSRKASGSAYLGVAVDSWGPNAWLFDLSAVPLNTWVTQSMTATAVGAPSGSSGFHTNGVNCDIDIDWWQLEDGAFATSNIVNDTQSQVTRSADSCSAITSPAWVNAAEGTLYAEFIPAVDIPSSVNQGILTLGDGTSANRIGIYRRGSDRKMAALVTLGGVTQASLTDAATPAFPSVTKVALAFKVNDFAFCVNGAASVTTASGSIPPFASLAIGDLLGSSAKFNGWLRDARVYPRRLSNAEIQALTA